MSREVNDEAEAHFGRLDVVFNNASFRYVGAAEELRDEELRQQLKVNLFGGHRLVRPRSRLAGTLPTAGGATARQARRAWSPGLRQ